MIQKSEIELKVPKNGFDIFSRPIPELEDKDIEVAHDIESKAWVISHMGEENVGKFGVGMKLGFALQCIKPDVMRCIFCFDDPPAIKNLAMVKLTIESIGGRLEIGDFTILKEYSKPEEEDVVAPIGMEVA